MNNKNFYTFKEFNKMLAKEAQNIIAKFVESDAYHSQVQFLRKNDIFSLLIKPYIEYCENLYKKTTNENKIILDNSISVSDLKNNAFAYAKIQELVLNTFSTNNLAGDSCYLHGDLTFEAQTLYSFYQFIIDDAYKLNYISEAEKTTAFSLLTQTIRENKYLS